MPNETQNLIFRILLEGKEEIVTLDVTKDKIEKINQSVSVAENSYEDLVAEALKYSQATVQNENALAGFIKAQGMNEQQIRKTIEALREARQQVALGSEDHARLSNAITNVTGASQRLVMQGLNPVGAQSSYARMAVQQFGFALGDASMFAVDFRMGMMGISNNLPFIAQNLAMVKQEAAAANVSMGSFIKQNLTGATGIVLGANLAAVALLSLPSIFKMINSSSEEAAEKGLKKFNEELKILTSAQILDKLDKLREKIKGINEENARYRAAAIDAMSGIVTSDSVKKPIDISEEDEKKKEQLTDEEMKILEQRKLRTGALKLDIDDLQKQIDAVQKDAADADQQIQNLTDAKAKKQKELNDLLKSTEDRNKEALANAEKLKQKEEERFNNALKEIGLRVELAELTSQDKYAAVQTAITEINKLLNQQNLSLEKEVELRRMLNSFYEPSKSAPDRPGAIPDEEKKRIEFFKRIDGEISELRVGAIKDENAKKLAELEKWKEDELKKYREYEPRNIAERRQLQEAISLIDQQYAIKRNEILKEEFQQKNKVTMSFVDASTAAFGTMWQELIVGGRQAKDPWDAIWLSFRNTALMRIGEIIQSEIWDELLKKIRGGGDGVGGSIFSAAFGIIGGPLGAFASLLYSAGSDSDSYGTMGSYDKAAAFTSADSNVIVAVNRIAEAMEKRISNIDVRIDAFEAARTIKMVNAFQESRKS